MELMREDISSTTKVPKYQRYLALRPNTNKVVVNDIEYAENPKQQQAQPDRVYLREEEARRMKQVEASGYFRVALLEEPSKLKRKSSI